MQYTIEAHKGVNKFEFGMTRAQAEAIAGPPDDVRVDDIMESTTEVRGPCELMFEDGILTSVTLLKQASPLFKGLNIFEQEGFDALCKVDPPVKGRGGKYVLFRELGLCIGGFDKKKIPEGKVVMVFPPDQIQVYESIIEV